MPPAIQCEDSGKWKWGNRGECVFKTKREAEAAGIAIQIQKIRDANEKLEKIKRDYGRTN
jgi:hypothetical protein